MVSRIMQKIKEMGLSCSAVEKRLGFGNGAIRRFETSSPSVEKIKSLSDFLNVSLDWLVKGKECVDVKLSKNEMEILKILNKLDDVADQAKLIGYTECYVDKLLDERLNNEGADAQQRLDKTS
ncbi:MAG: helix-turn-helix transcriptional regulator [Clostridia bacterium]|nr:helix-turn-helix transcriptional regulator [Clostridia bacterium]